MALRLLPNQSIIFDKTEDACNSTDNRRYCQLFNNEDILAFQVRQYACGNNVLCNPNLSTIVGSELVTNGTFTGSATGWSLLHATYNTNKVDFLGASTGVGYIKQNIAGMSASKVYQVTFTISNYVSGSLQPMLDNGVTLNYGQIVTGNGTFTQNILLTNISGTPQFYLNSNSGSYQFSVDDVSIKELTVDCWTASNSNIISNDGLICHIPGVASTLNQTGTLSNTFYYQINITIANRTQGSVTVVSGAHSTVALTANGTQVVYLIANGTDVKISMSADFDGCITYIDATHMIQSHSLQLHTLQGDYIADLASYSSFERDYVFYEIPMTYGSLKDVDNHNVEYGCYYLVLHDNCTNVDHTSNCISWKKSHDCTKHIIAYCDNDSLGFDFNGHPMFNRLKILAITPLYQQEEEDYLYSNGTRQITFSQSEKYFTIWFDYVDEITHDNINAMINCDHFMIDGVEYFIKKGQYQPDWDKDGRLKWAQSKIEGQVKGTAIFKTNG